MRLCDKACLARGFVTPYLVDLSTGHRIPVKMRHNTLSYASAEAMAAAFGGDASYIPSRMGFIYGSGTVNFPPITRNQSWDLLKGELSTLGGLDMQVVGFSYSPSLGAAPSGCDSDSSGSSPGEALPDEDYGNIMPTGSNAVTFHAVSNSSDPGVMETGMSFSGDNGTAFQAVLLGCNDGQYYVLSRVSLEGPSGYMTKPGGFEVALDWTVVFR